MTILPPSTIVSVCFVASFAWFTAGCQKVSGGTVELRVRAQIGLAGAVGLPDVEVCEVADTDNCVTTDANGWATLVLPRDEEVMWTMTKEGHGPALLADFTGEGFDRTTTLTMFTDRWGSEISEPFMTPYPPVGTGSIIIFTERPVVGATLELVNASGRVWYHDPDDRPDPDLKATSSNGGGGFFEVDPGEVVIEILGQTEDCTVNVGWHENDDNRIRVPVRAGQHTYAEFACVPP